jgi:hypothetical protein
MHTYSFHSYGKTGNQLAASYLALVQKINNTKIPVIVTEHNTRTCTTWDVQPGTPDDVNEASRLTSQILWLIKSGMSADYVFKFTVTANVYDNFIKKTGLHWSEFNSTPYDISDTTLAAEGMRLLSKAIKSKIYTVNSNTTKYNELGYMASSTGDGLFYLYIVNEGGSKFKTVIDLSKSGISFNLANMHLVESVGSGFFGEISSIQSGSLFTLNIDAYSVHRVAIQTGNQTTNLINANTACTIIAGNLSFQSTCGDSFFYVGTSNTTQQENTAVGLIQFSIPSNNNQVKRTILKV